MATQKDDIKVQIDFKNFKWVFIVVGIILLFASAFLDEVSPNWLILLMGAMGSTLLSAGAISLVLEASTIENYSKESINKILEANYPLNAYSDERLKYLNNHIAAKLGHVEKGDINNSLYVLNSNLIDLLDEVYYQNFRANYVFKPDLKKKVFHKTVETYYELINNYEKTNEVKFKLSLGPYSTPLACDPKDMIVFKEFKINKTDLHGKEKDYITSVQHEDEGYRYELEFNFPLQKCKSHKVKLKYSYDLDINDDYFIYRMIRPCKNAQINVTIHDDWVIKGTAFTAFYLKPDNDHGFSVDKKRPDMMEINLNDWCIPGAGFMVQLRKKM